MNYTLRNSEGKVLERGTYYECFKEAWRIHGIHTGYYLKYRNWNIEGTHDSAKTSYRRNGKHKIRKID
jgi:hypothetical protein